MKNSSISKKPNNDSAVDNQQIRTKSSRRALLVRTFGALLIDDNPVFKELYDEHRTRMSALDPARSKAHLQVGAVRFCVKAFLNYRQKKKGKLFYDRGVVDRIKQSGKITYNPFMMARIISLIDKKPANTLWKYLPCSLWVGEDKKIVEG